MPTIHEKLKAMRENAELSQEQIACYLGVPQIFIAKVETGERNLTVDQLESILSLHGCSLASFADMEQDVSPTPLVFQAVQETDPEDLRAIAAIGKIAGNSRFMARTLRRKGLACSLHSP